MRDEHMPALSNIAVRQLRADDNHSPRGARPHSASRWWSIVRNRAPRSRRDDVHAIVSRIHRDVMALHQALTRSDPATS